MGKGRQSNSRPLSFFPLLFLVITTGGIQTGAAFADGGGNAEDLVTPPNIILITVDTFRPDRLGYFGNDRDTSPILDALSEEGVFFTQAFTTSAWTTPGLISLHTSLYAPAHRVDVRGRSLAPEVETLADVLVAAGYRAPDIFFLTDVPNFKNLGLQPYEGRRLHLRQGDEILFRWLEEEAARKTARSGGNPTPPFFLYYHYRDLHQPYNPGPEYEALYTPASFGHRLNPLSWIGPLMAKEKMDLVKREVMLPRGVIDFAFWDKGWVQALYDGQVRKLDDQFFGRLRRTLEETGLGRNCLIIVSADHGEELLDHGLVGHVSTFKEAWLYDELIRIPLILWGPQHLPAGRIIDEPVQCIDVMPTLLELVGAPVPEGAQGRSLMPLINHQGRDSGVSTSWRPRPIFCETSGGGYTADPQQYAQRQRAVRTARWKLLHSIPENDRLLFDLERDPGERSDVSSEHPDVADSLYGLLREWSAANAARSMAASGNDDASLEAQSEAPHWRAALDDAGPEILQPQPGDTLLWAGADQSIQLRWTGEVSADYTIEYSVGTGVYHLEGDLAVTGSEPVYGPFQEDFWNSLVLYNPWTLRVFRHDRVHEKSEWVTFYLAPTAGVAGPSVESLSVIAAGSFRAGFTHGVNLARGLGLGLADLLSWTAQIRVADAVSWALIAALAAAVTRPLHRRLGPERCKAWGAASLYIAFVYATIPVFPDVWRTLATHTQGSIRHLGIVVTALILAVVAAMVWRRFKGSTILPYVALICTAICYCYLLDRFGKFPAERLHLLEYGLVAVLLLKALRLDMP